MKRAALSEIGTTELKAELKRRAKLAYRLIAKRKTLVRKLRNLDRQLVALGVDGTTRHIARRGKNSKTLPEAMASVMSKSKAMSVSQIEAGVKKAGYSSSSKTFRTIIFQTLKKNGQFRKIQRGQYVLK